MQVAVLAVVVLLSACAGNGLSVAPPAGVDLSGRWKLNEADSDDPVRLTQAANKLAAQSTGNAGNSGRGGQGGGRGNGRGPPGGSSPGIVGPPPPSMSVLGESLRWPGKQLEVHQVGGSVTFASDGRNRACQPKNYHKKMQHPNPTDRDMPAARDAPPPICGWADNTLIVRAGDPDDDRPPAEERYSLSEDGKRLMEEVAFRGGRSNGFTMSRVWDRVP